MRYGICILLALLPAAAPAAGILVLGDSLSAGYGIPYGADWVALMEDRLEQRCGGLPVHNASVSGETTAGGLERLAPLLLRTQPEIMILELGGNDGLRRQSLERMQLNLRGMIGAAREAGAAVLLLGMRIPYRSNPDYARKFAQVFAQTAAHTGSAYVPFFLDGIALDAALMQEDGIHPNTAAQPRLLANVWPALRPLLAELCAGSSEP